ncbi:MAG: right-handed parallel beta-helix repeat-containing protein, partial [Cohnella sp.]|nr:right-handed parallel beta-helix repeat-containing protein [Cohnella sp.]
MIRQCLKISMSGLLALTAYFGCLSALPTVGATGDTTPPAAVTITSGTPTSFYVKLNWNAPADDGSNAASGSAAKYDLRYSLSPINASNWANAKEVPFVTAPGTYNSAQWKTVSGLMPSTTYYFGLRTIDDAGNPSTISTKTITTGAQSCEKTITFNNNVTKVYGYAGTNNSGKQYLGSDTQGKVVCLASGSRTNPLELIDIQGTEDAPIKLVNSDGAFSIDTNNAGFGLKITNSKYFQLSGAGVSSIQRGIIIESVGPALQVKSGSSFYEIDHVDIVGTSSVGMQLHSDFGCTPDTDFSRDSGFVQKEANIHDNRIINTGAEGIYLGNSHYNEQKSIVCDGVTVPKREHAVEGVRVYNNVTAYTGWDGIQVGGATKDVKVYNNTVGYFSESNEHFQRSGIEINPGTTGDVFNNTIKYGTGHGIHYHGRGDSNIFNNLIIDTTDASIYIDDKTDPLDPGFYQGPIRVMNNTLVDPGSFGIEYRNDAAIGSLFYNNAFIVPNLG